MGAAEKKNNKERKKLGKWQRMFSTDTGPSRQEFRHSLRLFWLKESDPPAHSVALSSHEAAGMRHLYNIRPLKAVTFSYFPSSFHSPFNRETSVSEPVTPPAASKWLEKRSAFLTGGQMDTPMEKGHVLTFEGGRDKEARWLESS